MYKRRSMHHSAWTSNILGNKELGIRFHFHIRNIVALAMVALELKMGEAVAI